MNITVKKLAELHKPTHNIRRRHLRSTADLYSDPLPDRQDQVRCGRSPLAREYEQLGPVF